MLILFCKGLLMKPCLISIETHTHQWLAIWSIIVPLYKILVVLIRLGTFLEHYYENLKLVLQKYIFGPFL